MKGAMSRTFQCEHCQSPQSRVRPMTFECGTFIGPGGTRTVVCYQIEIAWRKRKMAEMEEQIRKGKTQNENNDRTSDDDDRAW